MEPHNGGTFITVKCDFELGSNSISNSAYTNEEDECPSNTVIAWKYHLKHVDQWAGKSMKVMCI